MRCFLRSLSFPPTVAALLAVFCAAPLRATAPWVHTSGAPSDFPLVAGRQAATLVVEPGNAEVVAIGARHLSADIERVSGTRPTSTGDAATLSAPCVLIGTLGRSPMIDRLVADHVIDVTGLNGAWESFVIKTVAPAEGRGPMLVIVGSDRRGTAYGVFELSQAIGVSPWHWWADVAPERHEELYVAAGTRRFGPPSVKYRGIFINDEDWGLQPWAAKTFEPENGGIGPKTYERVFELLLRLKANLLWPAMHACTKPFNSFPENAVLADRYAIVMGSSHAEPMLRDNVGEWKDRPERYNYVTNRDGVRAYWEARVKTNGRYENIYTLGMRGVHDSGIQGAKTDAERIRILEQVFADQREMLAKYAGGARPPGGLEESPAASPMGTSGSTSKPLAGARSHETDVEPIPQMFCAYKEVLGLYRQGLRVPDDVTIVWPDDNFGYVRNFATAEEQKRSGGFGVYYHLSYLGAPMAYLWLYTTPPGLVWEEMTKAYAYGARTIWVANVGDLKPAEIGTEFFLQLAWDVGQWGPAAQPEFLRAWAVREFGAANADEIAGIMGEYYRLNFQRKPEHLQWWLPKQPPQPSPFTRAEIDERLAAFAGLRTRVEAIEAKLPAEKRSAFFELVAYPVRGSALANERYFWGELVSRRLAATGDWFVLQVRARDADARLQAQTRTYNGDIAGGKWRGLMNLEPADEQWKSFRLSPWVAPDVDALLAQGRKQAPVEHSATEVVLAVEAGEFTAGPSTGGARWERIAGLGRSGSAITLIPSSSRFQSVADAPDRRRAVDYPFQVATAADLTATFYLVATQPIEPTRGLRFAVGVDDEPPVDVVRPVRDGSSDWAQGVLNATLTVDAVVHVRQPGRHVLRVYGTDRGVALDKIVLHTGPLAPSYFGPPTHR